MRNDVLRYIIFSMGCILALASCGRKHTTFTSDTVYVDKKIEVKIRDTVKEKETILLIDTVLNEIKADCPDVKPETLQKARKKLVKQCRLSELISPTVKDTLGVKIRIRGDIQTNELLIEVESTDKIINNETVTYREPTSWQCLKQLKWLIIGGFLFSFVLGIVFTAWIVRR
jgi:hypothetical protein